MDAIRLEALRELLAQPDEPAMPKRGHRITQRADAWEVTWRWAEAGKVWEDRQVAKMELASD